MTVYIVRNERNSLIKIGYTEALKFRLDSLRRTCKSKITLLRTVAGLRSTEQWMHNCFQRHRVKGEWYRFAEEMLSVEPPLYEPEAINEPFMVPNKDLLVWRKRERLTQLEAAEKFGVPYRTYCNWEYGIVAEMPGSAQKLWELMRR